MNVALKPFEPRDLELLKRWLSSPHVQPWYPDPARDIDIATSQPHGGFHALIAVGGSPVGYIRWQYVDRDTLDELGLQQIPANSVDIDILIGEVSQTAKGAGPEALELLAQQLLADSSVPMLGLTTSTQNFKAQRAFAKAGFSILLQYDPMGHGLCHLMVRDLRKERSSASWSPGA
jgi:RimJ/RimL family protein N-acetyltransferase